MRCLKKLVSTLILMSFMLSGCGLDDESTVTNNQTKTISNSGTFEVKVDGLVKFNDRSQGAKVHLAKPYLLGFKAKDWHVRISGSRLPSTGPAKTNKLERNNVLFSAIVQINGKPHKVGCKPAENPNGYFNRSRLTDNMISGEFSVEFISCSDYMTAKPVAYPQEPFIVSGRFNDIVLK